MMLKTPSLICALIMMTTGLLTCISVSADSTNIQSDVSANDHSGFAIQPLAQHNCNGTSHQYTYGSYTFWSTDIHNTTGRYGGFYIWQLTYYYSGASHPMIDSAYQTGILYKSTNGYWYHKYMQDYSTCISNVYIDGYGWHQYTQFTWLTSSGTIYYLADFGIESGNVHFGAYFWWKTSGQTYGVNIFQGWWHIEFQVGTGTNLAFKHPNTHITIASMNTPANWVSEQFKENSSGTNRYMGTDSSSYGTAGGSVEQDWAAINTNPMVDYLSLPNCADGHNLNTKPAGAEYIQATNLPNSDSTLNRAYDWTEWSGTWA